MKQPLPRRGQRKGGSPEGARLRSAIRIRLLFTQLVGLLAVLASSLMHSQTLVAGIARLDITAATGIPLHGYPDSSRVAVRLGVGYGRPASGTIACDPTKTARSPGSRRT